MKKILSLSLALILLVISLPQIQAGAEITPLSSENFKRAYINLSTSGNATFNAIMNVLCSIISVTNCKLQKFENGQWVHAASLTPPPSKANSTNYSVSKGYSDHMSHGTMYRIVATFEADGDTVTKTSNAITY